jgi:hypothetical protein
MLTVDVQISQDNNNKEEKLLYIYLDSCVLKIDIPFIRTTATYHN